jgi:hypothetical protein
MKSCAQFHDGARERPALQGDLRKEAEKGPCAEGRVSAGFEGLTEQG